MQPFRTRIPVFLSPSLVRRGGSVPLRPGRKASSDNFFISYHSQAHSQPAAAAVNPAREETTPAER